MSALADVLLCRSAASEEASEKPFLAQAAVFSAAALGLHVAVLLSPAARWLSVMDPGSSLVQADLPIVTRLIEGAAVAAAVLLQPMIYWVIARGIGGSGSLQGTASVLWPIAALGVLLQGLAGAFGPFSLPAALGAFLIGLAWAFIATIRAAAGVQAFGQVRAFLAVGVTNALLLGFTSGTAQSLVKARASRRVKEASQAMEQRLESLALPVAAPSAPFSPNAAPLYEQSMALLPPLSDSDAAALGSMAARPWSDPDGRLANLLATVQPALDKFREAAALSRCDFTEGKMTARGVKTPPPYPKGFTLASSLAVLRGRQLEAQGDPAALGWFLAAMSQAGHLAQQRNFILSALLMRRLALLRAASPLLELVSDGQVNAAGYDLIDVALRAQPAPDFGAMVRDNFELVGAVEGLQAQTMLSTFSDETAAAALTRYEAARQRWLDAAVKAAEDGSPESMAAFDASFKAQTQSLHHGRQDPWKDCLQQPARFGECFAATPANPRPDYASLLTPLNAAEARLRLLAAGTALRRYELATRAPAADLQILVPQFLAALPEDPFDHGHPLKYRASPDGSWILYSVGPDKRDDAGAVLLPPPELWADGADLKGDIALAARPAPPPPPPPPQVSRRGTPRQSGGPRR